MFFFTGVVANNQPAFDTKINYTYKGWNGMFFKSFELNEQSPAMNYALYLFYHVP